MSDALPTSGESSKPADHKFGITPPQISLPKGGGAVQGIGEKFTSNPVTGTGSLRVPIATSPGRSGFGPQLALSYDSGTGNGAFGIGWNLPLPAITRKTDKGLPQYRDAEESDVFILSGSEDLVPAFKRNADGSVARDQHGDPVPDEESRNGYFIKRYRPRIEGLFARIERWTGLSDGDTHWRSISKDNVLTVYGSTAESRIADPANPHRIFSWLICQSYDDKGNAVVYDHVAENGDNVDLTRSNERNRERSANRYLKRIRYGNRQPLLIDPALPSFRRAHVPAPDFKAVEWMFEVVFDYGEGHYHELPPDADGRMFVDCSLTPPAGATWPLRADPFSTYRSCFEVRSYRLCRRVLMFHHFREELGADDCLVHSTELVYLEQPHGSFVAQVLQSGYKRIGQHYLKRALPPLEFGYSTSPLDDLTHDQLPLQEVDETSLQNLPAGIDSSNYRWIDLDGEGISGVLAEQAGVWFYKRNLGEGRFGPVEAVAPLPSLAALNRGRQELMDLAGDGLLDLVDFSEPTPGFFERSEDTGWDSFRAFGNLPHIDWRDKNLRFVDLTGDGLADILITEEQVYTTWHESQAEQGYGPARHVPLPLDEEDGPRLLFADGTQSIYLADMSGDGMSDLVRIRVSEVCYWPNTGYGRFGKKVTMDNAAWFDDIASFDQRRIRLSDTDGSGPTDIIYLGGDGVRIYLNEHGNSLSTPRLLNRVPRTDNFTTVSVADFLGRGTACLLWSSPLPGDARRPLRYLDLMGGTKPQLLTTIRNNLGTETTIEYASSTRFYLADRAAGMPWVTHLPFPVHVITRVETRDLISGNRFVKRLAYHHGYFDGVEREFRGFARVDTWDSEEFGVPAAEAAFQLPPTLTKTWLHTGAYRAGERISRHLAAEYYQEGDPDLAESALSPAQRAAMLLDDTVLPSGLDPAEVREAVRALKGAMLREEIYALDDSAASDRPYVVSERNYSIRIMQPRSANRHAVFFTHALESLEFHYERKLYPVLNGQIVDAANPGAEWRADPRVLHSVNLAVDDYGNVRQSVAIGYGRRFDDPDPVLNADDRKQQKQLLATYTEAGFTNAAPADDAWRTPLPAEVLTYELIKIKPAAQQPAITNLFRCDELLALTAQAGDGAHDLPYEDIDAAGATGSGPWRRLVEQMRTRYRSNDLSSLLPLRVLQVAAVPGEEYKLALTPGLLGMVYQRGGENLLPDPAAILPVDATHDADRGGYVDFDGDGRWWVPSGRVCFHPDAAASPADELAEAVSHFFLARRFIDPFMQSSQVDYAHDLLPVRTRDALGNTTEAVHDYRVLQPQQMNDPNGNRSFAAFDAFGLPIAIAAAGKVGEALGDSLDDFGDFDADPGAAQLQDFVARPRERAAELLKSASRRFVYDLDRFRRCGEPPFAATLARETHAGDPLPPQGLQIQSRFLLSFLYSDGFGRELQSKLQAEPGQAPLRAADLRLPGGDIGPGPLQHTANGALRLASADPRWVGKGRTVYNNKGKPVKQYEPFFSSTHLYEAETEMTDSGVASILFYDPLARVIASLHPNHTYEKVVFDSWRQESWDVNDTVLQSDPRTDPDAGVFFKHLPAADYLPTWYEQRRLGQQGPEEKAAADKAAAHAGTPSVVYFDALGRSILTLADNGKDANGAAQKFATRVAIDIEGNQRSIKDAMGRIVMHYAYDMLGNRIQQSSMDAGQRWMLNDAAGNAIRGWNARGHATRHEYDALRRPTRFFVSGTDAQNPGREICFRKIIHGESPDSGLTPNQMLQANLRGKPYKQFDSAGVVSNEEYDFKGNLLRSTRQLVQDCKTTADWSQTPVPVLETEIFSSRTRYDALNRPVQLVAPHRAQAGAGINVVRPGYNEAGLLERMDVWLAQVAEPADLLDPASASLNAIVNIDYDAKGQRGLIEYGNGAATECAYDDKTFRLKHLKTSRAGAALQNLFYTYDPAGNITRIRDDAQQTIFFNGQVVLPQCGYTYDATYRLIAASGREHIGQLAQPETTWDDGAHINLPQPGDGQAMRNYKEQYQYDAVGNFEKLVHQANNANWTRNYLYNETSLTEPGRKSNRLSGTSVGAATEKYLYDAHGNMIGMPHLTLMQWDFRDQLSATARQAVTADQPPGKVPETSFYIYDADGQRVRKITERQNGTRKAERIYIGGFELYREFGGDGSDVALERETLHVMDGKQRIALVESRTQGDDGSPQKLVRYQLGNHLGSVGIELDQQARLISYEEYCPYGSTSYQSVDQGIKAAAKRYRFTGKERDEETGLEYHGARYYATWLGIWTSCDPAGITAGINAFTYCLCRPIVLFDPDGRNPTPGVQPIPFGRPPPPPPWINPPPSAPQPPPVEPPSVRPAPPVGTGPSPDVKPRIGFLPPWAAGALVFVAIMLTPSNTATNYSVTYQDPDTGKTLRFRSVDELTGYQNKKAYEKRIAPGAGDASSEKKAPGARDSGEVSKDPTPSDTGPKIAPGPAGQPGSANFPGQADPKGDPLIAAQKSHSGDKVPYTITGTQKDFDAVKGTSVYVLKDKAGNVLYVGKGDVWGRLRSHISDPLKTPWFGEIAQIEIKGSELTNSEALALEQDLIRQLGPHYNKDLIPYETEFGKGEPYAPNLPKAQIPRNFKVNLGQK